MQTPPPQMLRGSNENPAIVAKPIRKSAQFDLLPHPSGLIQCPSESGLKGADRVTTASSWLITGANGQIGRRLTARLGDQAQGLSHAQLDITDPAALRDVVRHYRPALLVNCAAFTHVDGAESDTAAAHAVNAQAPARLAETCRMAGIPLIHLSTDYVFDGQARSPYDEDAATAPLSVYGESKLQGEQAVLASGAVSAVLRTAWVFDRPDEGFVGAVLRRGRQQDSLNMVADQWGCPTPAAAVAEAIHRIGERLLAGRGETGLFHYAGAPVANRLDWARAILDAGGLDHVALQPVSSDAFPTPARRPVYSALDCRRILGAFGLRQPDWRAALQHSITETLS